MPQFEVAPYFYPTQVVLVDDDIHFLGNLSLQLDASLAYLLFDSTRKALEYIKRHQGNNTDKNRFFCSKTPGKGNGQADEKRQSLVIDPKAIWREMYSSHRFSRVSTVLVDYEMPQMNGLEFCRTIKDPHVKKVLFTGAGTESMAVEAFNAGIIDRFIRKHEYAVYELLNQTIKELQEAYMRDFFVAASNTVSLEVPDLLADTSVAQMLDVLRSDYGMVEYYFAHEAPEGFFFMNAQGERKRVVVPTVRDLQHLGQRLAAAGLPQHLTSQISRAEKIPSPSVARLADMGTGDEQYRGDAMPARPMPDGTDGRKWAVFDVVLDNSRANLTRSYDEFLDWLDTVGYSLM